MILLNLLESLQTSLWGCLVNLLQLSAICLLSAQQLYVPNKAYFDNFGQRGRKFKAACLGTYALSHSIFFSSYLYSTRYLFESLSIGPSC